MLASYRERLSASWQNGAPVQAAQARRAMQFANASHGADAQIGQAAQRAREQLEAAITSLGQIQARRRALAEAMRKQAVAGRTRRRAAHGARYSLAPGCRAPQAVRMTAARRIFLNTQAHGLPAQP